MTYNNPENLSSVTSIFIYANSVSDNIFGIGICISLYLIVLLYLILKGNYAPDSAIVAGFLSSITAIFLLLMGLIGSKELFIVFIVFVLSVIWSYLSKS